MRFGVSGFDAVSVFFVAQGEEIVLGGGYAVETELEIGAGVGKLRFYGSSGLQGLEVAAGEFVVGGQVFAGEVEDLA